MPLQLCQQHSTSSDEAKNNFDLLKNLFRLIQILSYDHVLAELIFFFPNDQFKLKIYG
jgi:hypothetical protein